MNWLLNSGEIINPYFLLLFLLFFSRDYAILPLQKLKFIICFLFEIISISICYHSPCLSFIPLLLSPSPNRYQAIILLIIISFLKYYALCLSSFDFTSIFPPHFLLSNITKSPIIRSSNNSLASSYNLNSRRETWLYCYFDYPIALPHPPDVSS